jgi:hypothetical protein
MKWEEAMPALFETESILGHIATAEECVRKRPQIAIAHALIAVAKTLQRIDDEVFDVVINQLVETKGG